MPLYGLFYQGSSKCLGQPMTEHDVKGAACRLQFVLLGVEVFRCDKQGSKIDKELEE